MVSYSYDANFGETILLIRAGRQSFFEVFSVADYSTENGIDLAEITVTLETSGELSYSIERLGTKYAGAPGTPV